MSLNVAGIFLNAAQQQKKLYGKYVKNTIFMTEQMMPQSVIYGFIYLNSFFSFYCLYYSCIVLDDDRFYYELKVPLLCITSSCFLLPSIKKTSSRSHFFPMHVALLLTMLILLLLHTCIAS